MNRTKAIPQVLQGVQKMLKNGATYEEIAAQFGTTRQTISRWARKMGYRRTNAHCFSRETQVMQLVLDETATFWALFAEFEPLEILTQQAQQIADILHNYPACISCKKCYQHAAGLALHCVRLLRILANAASKATDRHQLFDCFIFIDQTAVSALSILSEC